MKIHGTAKGAALSTKDFGVAFGGAAADWIDDTGLKAYYKFNESSGSIINQSESDDSLSSNADIAMTGGTYEQSAPIGSANAVLFDGSSDKGEEGTSLSQWNYKHNTTSEFSMAFWAKFVSVAGGNVFFSTAQSESHVGWQVWCNDTNRPLSFMTSNGSGGRPMGAFSTNNYIPDLTNWHFYVITCNITLANSNVIFTRDNANQETFNKTAANVPSDANATQSAKVAVNPASDSDYGNFYVSELSEWNRILTADEITGLYNDGNARAIYE